jgi:hypothetical protein
MLLAPVTPPKEGREEAMFSAAIFGQVSLHGEQSSAQANQSIRNATAQVC